MIEQHLHHYTSYHQTRKPVPPWFKMIAVLQILHTYQLKSHQKRHFSTPGRKDRIYWKHFGRFGDNYLMNLWERSQINLKSPWVEAKEIPSKGNIVQIKVNLPRGTWKIGKIIELLPNSESKLRPAKVSLATKSTVNRPLNLLYPIKCESTVNDKLKKASS